MNPVDYTLCPADPAAHYFDVTLHIPEPDPEGQRLRLPAWIPGSYMIRDFARHIVELSAISGGADLAVSREDKSTWRCAPAPGALDVRYRVYAWDLSVRAAHLDMTHGFFNGTSVFLEVVGQSASPCRVTIEPPRDERCGGWQVATALQRVDGEAYGFGRFRADHYDELVDHPVEMGTFDVATFEACGVPHEIVLTGRHRADMDRLCRDLKKICEHHIRFFGGSAPMDRYVFLTMVVGDGYGGLEHRASTALMTKREALPVEGEEGIGRDYRNFLGLCSHEYFHSWNVKRIKPAAFSPYQLEAESHTRLLWAFEGITSYYDDLALVRCGLIARDDYLEQLAQTLSRVWRGKGRHRQSVSDSSFDAWTRFYKQDENAPNAIASYYTKGAVIALCLDAAMRRRASSLDELMEQLWSRHGSVGVEEGDIEALVAELAGDEVAEKLAHWVGSTEDPDVASALAELGVDLQWRAPGHQNDWGGAGEGRADGEKPALGARVVAAPEWAGAAKVQVVYEGEAAHRAGLAAGDILVALDGLRVSAADIESRLAAYPVGEVVPLHAFRRDELRVVDLPLWAPPKTAARLTPREGGVEVRRAWLGPAAE
ncbi:MAG: M61 family metallopeptidase [Pseudomonadota bacterium]